MTNFSYNNYADNHITNEELDDMIYFSARTGIELFDEEIPVAHVTLKDRATLDREVLAELAKAHPAFR